MKITLLCLLLSLSSFANRRTIYCENETQKMQISLYLNNIMIASSSNLTIRIGSKKHSQYQYIFVVPSERRGLVYDNSGEADEATAYQWYKQFPGRALSRTNYITVEVDSFQQPRSATIKDMHFLAPDAQLFEGQDFECQLL